MNQTPGQERLHIIHLINSKGPEKAAEAIMGLMKIDRGIARKEGEEIGFKKAAAGLSSQRSKVTKLIEGLKAKDREALAALASLGFDIEHGD